MPLTILWVDIRITFYIFHAISDIIPAIDESWKYLFAKEFVVS